MAKLITDALKELYTAQGVTATGDTIADVLKDGNAKAYSATVSGNQIADVISQTAETGTFSGGGAAPTVVNEITWDGNTEGLESAEVDLGSGTSETYYKVNDNVLPFQFVEGTNAYSYSCASDHDDTSTPSTIIRNDLFVGSVDGGEQKTYNFVCAFYGNIDLSDLGGSGVVPSAGTWINVIDTHYIASITATPAN
jgi:hypothetical protein